MRKSHLADCRMSAEDCKSNADYAAYAFKRGDEEKGREYVQRLEENLSRLKAQLYSVEYSNKKIKEFGPDAPV